MDIIYPRCCGLDVHKREVVACVVITEPDGTLHKAVRAFGTMTPDILALADWLTAHEVSHVAMESTGVYLEAALEPAGGQFQPAADQCPARQGGAGTQDRHSRL